jgi:hypothetical protein
MPKIGASGTVRGEGGNILTYSETIAAMRREVGVAIDPTGFHPISMPAQLGCCSVAPLRPHIVQRADRRSTSLDASGPQRMISGTKARALIAS